MQHPSTSRRDSPIAIRSLLRAGYSKTVVREALGAADHSIEVQYRQLLGSGMPPAQRLGNVSPTYAAQPRISAQAAIVLALYQQLAAPQPTGSLAVDIPALTSAYTLARAAMMDRDIELSVCINRLYRIVQLFLSGDLELERSDDGRLMLVVCEQRSEAKCKCS